ncbi:hypothetical protein ACFL27_14285 [candidate division CSSED10-310 bacterium]|uniref:FRG domain-containing protein n=1 Tax=candidate division CSSED10-310 bacterium TaxID=2855610 RepID=A0ABV6YYU2_UNCC1
MRYEETTFTKHEYINGCFHRFARLGFSIRLKNAHSDAELLEIYQDLRFVHEQFEKNIEKHKKVHELTSKKVIALSDALVIAVNFDAKNANTLGLLDFLGDQLYGLAIAQAVCHANGIYLRGCVTQGQFFFANDILISKAQVIAYETETKSTVYPVIRVEDELAQFLIEHNENRNYGGNNNPMDFLLMDYNLPGKDRIKAKCLDYLTVGIQSSADWLCEEDRRAYLRERQLESESFTKYNAVLPPEFKPKGRKYKTNNSDLDKNLIKRTEEKDFKTACKESGEAWDSKEKHGNEARKILEQAYRANQFVFLDQIKKNLESELNKAHDKHVLEKYIWTAMYYNKIIKDFSGNSDQNEIIINHPF